MSGLLASASGQSSSGHGLQLLVAFLLTYAAVYLVSLRIWPYTACGRCDGSGRNAGSNRDRWGSCRKCGGGGRKERLGVRLFTRKS